MAGSYPDVPGPRMAYDRDGTLLYHRINGGASVADTSGFITSLNDEDFNVAVDIFGSYSAGTYQQIFIFPELRSISGMFCVLTNTGGTATVEYSSNTTTGDDGTWTSGPTLTLSPTTTAANARSNIDTDVTITSCKAVRFAFTRSGEDRRYFRTVHIYGAPVTSTGDRLRFWHPTNDVALTGAYFDWGNVYQGQTVTPRQFRIKNTSSTLTASTITISRQALTDGGTQTTVAGHTLSDDNVTYGTTASISSLAPGAISSIKYVKYAPTSSATTGLRWMRLNAVAASWA